MITTDRLVLSPLQVSDAAEMEPVLSAGALYHFTGGTPPSLDDLERALRSPGLRLTGRG